MEAIDPESIEFLDKELLSDLVLGDEKEADIVVRAQIAGKPSFVLIHVENRAKPQTEFRTRMFDYFTWFRAKFALPIYPIAVFTFSTPYRKEPRLYEETVYGLEVLKFRFQVVQLNLLNWRDYAGTDNPIATAWMAKMRIPPEDRVKVRMECLRLFVTLKLDKKKQQTIDEFMRTYLRLTTAEMQKLRKEIETTMPAKDLQEYVTVMNEWEEAGMKRGLEQGIEKGIEEGVKQGLRDGEVRLVLRMLKSKFGALPEPLTGKITGLELSQLEDLGVALLDFKTMEEAQVWLETPA